MGGSVTVRARALAKINLSLRVLGTRADGYHDLRHARPGVREN